MRLQGSRIRVEKGGRFSGFIEDSETEKTAVDEDKDAAPGALVAVSQHEATNSAPSADPVNTRRLLGGARGAAVHSGMTQEIAHHNNDEAEE